MSSPLNEFLKPITYFLEQDDVSEICINQPMEIWVEKKSTFQRHDITLSGERLSVIAGLIAEYNGKKIPEFSPMLSASLPSGERVQIVKPPACDKNQFILSIRKASVKDMGLEDWESLGAFNAINNGKDKAQSLIAQLKLLYDHGQWRELIQTAVRGKLNIIISGGTSTAKTTFLNSCLKEIPAHERLVTVEGVREVKTTLPNTAHLVANEDDHKNCHYSMLDLLKVCFRLRPDRIFLSELRSQEAYPYLRACISGHPGSITTLHANSIAHAKEQMCFMLSESSELKGVSEARLKSLINQSTHLFIQMKRQDDGARVIDEIELMDFV